MNYIDGNLIKLEDFDLIEKEPNSKTMRINIVVHIKNNKTGKTVEYKTEMIWRKEENKPFTWIWEEGNFSCDCTRSLFSGSGDIECSDGKFSVNIFNPKNGKMFYQEFQEQ